MKIRGFFCPNLACFDFEAVVDLRIAQDWLEYGIIQTTIIFSHFVGSARDRKAFAAFTGLLKL